MQRNSNTEAAFETTRSATFGLYQECPGADGWAAVEIDANDPDEACDYRIQITVTVPTWAPYSLEELERTCRRVALRAARAQGLLK